MQFMLTHAAKLSCPEQTEAGGQLNPQWVEWLMGYPVGWTVESCDGTGWFRGTVHGRDAGGLKVWLEGNRQQAMELFDVNSDAQ
jgi:hypothetical protein